MIGVLTAGLLGAATVTVAAPAYAATVSTSASLEASADLVVFGDDIYLDGDVTGVDAATGVATYVTTGTISLQVLTSKDPTWVTVATDTTPSSYFFSDIKPESNAQYKVVYSGGASTTDTFTPSESAPVSVGVQRKVKVAIKSEQLTLKVTVKPDFAKRNIKVFIQEGQEVRAPQEGPHGQHRQGEHQAAREEGRRGSCTSGSWSPEMPTTPASARTTTPTATHRHTVGALRCLWASSRAEHG